ncbi:MAG: SCO family protein [Oligoflexales bacterium]|nr:SCO family protein [Oligoflexales bacterium]
MDQNDKKINPFVLLLTLIASLALSALFLFLAKNQQSENNLKEQVDKSYENNFFYFQASPAKQKIEARINTIKGGQTLVELLKGRWSLVFFGYTFCPDICPLSMKITADLLKQMNSEHPEYPLQVLFISVDPERDSREKLDKFSASFKTSGLYAYTSSEQELKKIMNALQTNYFYEKKSSTDENYAVQHPSGFYLFSPQSEYMGRFTGTNQSGQIKKELLDFLSDTDYPSVAKLQVELDSEAAMGVGYFEIQGSKQRDYTLKKVSIESRSDSVVEMHESLEVDGMHKMQELPELKISKSSQQVFAPGGKHLMLMNLNATELSNTELALKFEFSDGLSLSYRARIITR